MRIPSARVCLAWLAVAAWPAQQTSVRAQQASPPTPAASVPAPEGLARLAAELAQLEQGLAPVTVAQRIHAFGPASAADVFEALSRDELPLGEETLALGARQHEVLLDGARRLGREAFGELWRTAASGPDLRRRLTAIELIGVTGKGADLATAVQAALPLEPGGAFDPPAVQAVEKACASLLASDCGTFAFLRPAILNTPPGLAGYLIRAAGHTPTPRTLDLFVDILGFEPCLDLTLLSQIGRMTRGQPPPFDEHLRARVREYLSDPDRQLVRTAVMTLAELQDEDAIPQLIDMTKSGDAAFSGAAFLALERTAGLSLPRRTDRWLSWLATEQAWIIGAAPLLRAALEGDDLPRALAALTEISRHRLGRQRLAAAVAGLLVHEDRRVRLESCRTLRALGCIVARESLEQALQDDDPEVTAAAQSALRALGVNPDPT